MKQVTEFAKVLPCSVNCYYVLHRYAGTRYSFPAQSGLIMKKHIITLSALVLGVSTICFVGCGGEEDFTPSTNDQQGVEISDEKDKADAEKQGFNAGPPGGSQGGDGGGKKED